MSPRAKPSKGLARILPFVSHSRNDTAAAMCPSDEVDAGVSTLVDSDHPDRLLRKVASELPGDALRPPMKGLTGPRTATRFNEVDDDRRLALSLPEAAGLDVRRGLKTSGDTLLNPTSKPRGVDGDRQLRGRLRTDAAADEKLSAARRRKLAEGPEVAGEATTAGKTGTTTSHSRSVPRAVPGGKHPRERAGRWPDRRWVYIEPTTDGKLRVEISWLPSDVQPSGFRRTATGDLFLIVPGDDGGLALRLVLADVAAAFTTAGA